MRLSRAATVSILHRICPPTYPLLAARPPALPAATSATPTAPSSTVRTSPSPNSCSHSSSFLHLFPLLPLPLPLLLAYSSFCYPMGYTNSYSSPSLSGTRSKILLSSTLLRTQPQLLLLSAASQRKASSMSKADFFNFSHSSFARLLKSVNEKEGGPEVASVRNRSRTVAIEIVGLLI